MLINAENIDFTFRGFKTVYSDAFDAAISHAGKVAMTVPSSAREEQYGWMGQFPNLREWIGPRHVPGGDVRALETHSPEEDEATAEKPRGGLRVG